MNKISKHYKFFATTHNVAANLVKGMVIAALGTAMFVVLPSAWMMDKTRKINKY